MVVTKGPHELTDAELLAQAQKGDQDALGTLFKKHYRSCVNIATFILGDRGDAEDEVQKACCKAFEHLDQFRGDAEFLTWLLRIVSNQCLMLIRIRRRARFLYIDADDERDRSRPIELPAMIPGPENEVMDLELHAVLRKEISHIPPLFRTVLMLHDVEELPMPDVAARLKITVPAAKSRLLRARSELRERVMRHCVTPGRAKRVDAGKDWLRLRTAVKPRYTNAPPPGGGNTGTQRKIEPRVDQSHQLAIYASAGFGPVVNQNVSIQGAGRTEV